ncbi:MAG TPA: hypothetical protein VHB97_26055 [Polyangia bacterium]|nr:hypothetical protein [Polyangia bacterium]
MKYAPAGSNVPDLEMTQRAPMHVPVEISRGDGRTRWFRLTTHVSADALLLAHPIPEEVAGPLAIAFHLPGDAVPVRCGARAAEAVVGEGEEERAERRAVIFTDIEEEARARVTTYVSERLGLS